MSKSKKICPRCEGRMADYNKKGICGKCQQEVWEGHYDAKNKMVNPKDNA